MGWMDTHCHLCLLKEEQGTIAAIIDQATREDVTRILDVSTGADNWQCVLNNAKTHSQVYAAIGVHPTSEDVDIDWRLFEQLVQDDKVIAIGECGLDFYHEPEDNCAYQYPRFLQQIEIAKRVHKPLIIHTRNSSPQTLSVLKEHAAGHINGIMHCFVEDINTAKQALDIGFYLSFSGIVTFKNAKQVQEVLAWAPMDRILIETDSPYLAPVPYRGKLNQPAYVSQVGHFLATQKGLSIEDTMQILENNAKALFRI